MAGRIDIPKETLQQFVNRYHMLATPEFRDVVMRSVAYELDKLLVLRLETSDSHPVDTGLLKRSWVIPELYLKTHRGKIWSVYALNTATVGKQAELKALKEGYKHRKRKRIGRHNLKRYMEWVYNNPKSDLRETYKRQLRVVTNKINPIFKEKVVFLLAKLYSLRPELFSAQEVANLNEDA